MSLSSPMASPEHPFLREPLGSGEEVGPDPETKEESLAIESPEHPLLREPLSSEEEVGSAPETKEESLDIESPEHPLLREPLSSGDEVGSDPETKEENLDNESPEHPLLREPLSSKDEVGSDPEIKEESLDIELGTIHKLKVPRQWLIPKNSEYCCIYRVPEYIRKINPEAYTPQLLIIGPLHHSLKSQALKSLKSIGDATTTKLMNYLNMEEHKKFYLSKFAQTAEGEKTIGEFRKIIERNEEKIRASYSESTAWIESAAFVDMILHDSFLILEWILMTYDEKKTIDDILKRMSLIEFAVMGLDLLLLENQLPYFILEELFEPIIPKIISDKTFRELVINVFEFEDKIKNNSTFRHFTDLYRLGHLDTLPAQVRVGGLKQVECVHNACKLDSGGVKLEVGEKELLYVRFENGCLKIPFLRISDDFEIIVRNIMALEQCHDPWNAHVCNYVNFMDNLIDTDKDVELLIEKGIIENHIGHHGSVAEMFNKLCLGIYLNCGGSYYNDIAAASKAYYSNPVNKSLALLKRVYFGNLWTGTATVAATILLLLTLTQTITSIMQVTPKK